MGWFEIVLESPLWSRSFDSEWCTSFFFVFLCFASLIRVIMVLSGFIYLGLKTMPKDIVSKFCLLLGKCGQQVDIKGTIRESYLFEVDSIFSFLLLGPRNGAFWAVLVQFVKDDDNIGRVSGSKFESSEERY